jgi:hypothetical protein
MSIKMRNYSKILTKKISKNKGIYIYIYNSKFEYQIYNIKIKNIVHNVNKIL